METENAIKKYQEKHKKEILIPNGFKKPTGIWGKSTALFAKSQGLCKNDTVKPMPKLQLKKDTIIEKRKHNSF